MIKKPPKTRIYGMIFKIIPSYSIEKIDIKVINVDEKSPKKGILTRFSVEIIIKNLRSLFLDDILGSSSILSVLNLSVIMLNIINKNAKDRIIVISP